MLPQKNRRVGETHHPNEVCADGCRLALPTLRLCVALALTSTIAHAATRPSNAEIYFQLENPCPVTGQTAGPCKGYVVDRVIPLVCGGPDDASNMRWLTLAEAKEKARWDRIGCRRGRRLVLPGQDPPHAEAHAIGEPVAPVESEPLPPQ